MIDINKSRLDKLDGFLSPDRIISLFVKRDDLIHEEVSGNKWRKLKYNIELCQSRKNKGVLTFGGAYSNHLVATAAACKEMGLESIGFVRGDELKENSNDTLKRCVEFGMKLIFISREEYRLKNEKAYQEGLSLDYPNFHIVPEGGANYYGMIGCQEIITEIKEDIDHVFVSQGTATTSCGILLALEPHQQLHVVPALKGYESEAEMRALIGKSGIEPAWTEELLSQVEVLNQYHFGGYGKCTEELFAFMRMVYNQVGFKLDPVYTGKAFFGMFKELENRSYDNSNVLFVHTGGIQGIHGVEQRMKTLIY